MARIHGICLVKNEADFIEQGLRHNAERFDRIYVYDNASTDGTWDIVQDLARELPDVIVPFASEDRDFRDGLRARPFLHYRDQAETGDWWCRLDGDELYIDDPKEFLAAVPAAFHVVWAIHLQYYFTEADRPGGKGYPSELTHPFPDLPRHYLANASEPRFFRHRPKLNWSPDDAWPRHVGLVYPERIRLRHYQWRTPDQIQRRLDTRREAAERGYRTFLHTIEKSWQEKIRPIDDLELDCGDGTFTIDHRLLPHHLERLPVRLLKRLLHGAGIWP